MERKRRTAVYQRPLHPDGADEVKENVALLNATVSYRACRTMQLWVKGENLLAQKYEINYGYPMPKATFMAGVNLSF